ncbi:MAG TPA: hypothetical protein VIT90_06705 [Lysobacter sp.]
MAIRLDNGPRAADLYRKAVGEGSDDLDDWSVGRIARYDIYGSVGMD